LHEHAQLQVGIALFVDQLLDLVGRGVGEDERSRHFGGRCCGFGNSVHANSPKSFSRYCRADQKIVLKSMKSTGSCRFRCAGPGARGDGPSGTRA